MLTMTRVVVALALTLAAWPVQAQITSGSIAGRVSDPQGAALPGVAVRATSADTGFVRSAATDDAGNYRLAALPVGAYRVVAEAQGFRPFTSAQVIVNISRTFTLDITLPLAGVAETVQVAAVIPLISTRSSSIGQVVDLPRIEGLPLNGRQFANLAATVPGVGLGFHADVTKSAQYTPQISGGNGRNVNYVVDGGDNNDDTVGGLLQLFPLEAIQEFDVITHRFDAEYGRSNGAVLNVVTKSGTNDLRGSWFTLVRDEALNARTVTERRSDVGKQPYERYQFGGSVGGPVRRDRLHYFAAYERTQQDTKQSVNTFGLYPADEGIFDVPFRQNLVTVKLTGAARRDHYVSVRYGSDWSSQPSGATPNATRSSWSTSSNTFNSVNLNHNWTIGGRALNELVFQFSDFENNIPTSTPGPAFRFQSIVTAGANAAAPQSTEQRKWQLRNDFSRSATLLGSAHELKGGINWVHEPVLRVFTGGSTEGFFEVGALDLNGPVVQVLMVGNNPTANFPLDQYGLYVQDNWRVGNRLTLNLGVRWDYVDGMPIDQSNSTNFQLLQAAGQTGRFAGTVLEDFGQPTRADKDNVQPRLGAVLDARGNGRDIIRGGWGLYTDFGYTSSNVLTAGFDAVGAGLVFLAASPQGLRKADGTLFRISDPLSSIAHLNAIPAGTSPAGEVVSPLLEAPYTRQANIGWAHQIGDSTAFTADYVRVDGRQLNMRIRPNTIVGGQRVLAGVGVSPGNQNFRTAVSKGSSRYDGLIVALRRRMSDGVDLTASYTLSEATSDVGTAYDEILQNLIQDIRDPFGPVQRGPSARVDSRHAISISGIIQAPWQMMVAPIFYYRSALPVHTQEGIDLNADSINNDITASAYRFTGTDDHGVATFVEDGRCETVNCSRRAGFSQLNLRVSRGFRLSSAARIEAIAEIFNLFNAKNPSLLIIQRRLSATGAPNPQFMQPAGFAGDVGQPEQRVGQLGFRITF